LFSDESKWRSTLLLEAWPDRGHWTAIHTGQFIYIETDDDLSEFYNLELDPYEMDNMIDNPEYQPRILELKEILQKEKERDIPSPE
jgi:hypothetical protein